MPVNWNRNVGEAGPALTLSQEPGAAASGNPALAINQADSTGAAITVKSAGRMIDLQTVTGASKFAVDGSGNLTAAGSLAAPNMNWGPSDQGFLAWNYDGPSSSNGGSVVLATAGTMYTMAIRVPVAISVTNIVTTLQTNGGTLTSGQCFAALYQGAGGARIGVTADQTSAWGSGAVKSLTMALAGGPFAVAAGVVYVGFWFNGTTGPAFYRTGTQTAIMNLGLADTAARFGTANTGLTTTAPATLGTITAAGSVAAYWVALS